MAYLTRRQVQEGSLFIIAIVMATIFNSQILRMVATLLKKELVHSAIVTQ